MSEAQVNFVRQQGFTDASVRTCDFQYPALMFQPRVIGALALVGVMLQAPWLFLALSAVLWWNVAVPTLNPFDRLYDTLVGARRGLPPLPPAPAPRRFSQAIAASFTVVIGASLLAGWTVVAWIFGRFCLGSYVFLLLARNGKLARRTLPWSRGA